MALLRGLVVGFGTFLDVKVGCAVLIKKVSVPTPVW